MNTTATATLIQRKKKVTTFWKKETFFFLGERFQGNTLLLKTFILFFENILFNVAKTFPFLKTWFLEKKEMDPTCRNIILLEENNFHACHFRISKEKKENEIFIFDVFFIFIFFRFIYF